jgi:hypothetical protein
VAPQLVEGPSGGLGQHPHDDVGAGVEAVQLGSQQMAQPPADRVSGDRGADSLGDYETGSRTAPHVRYQGLLGLVKVDHETISSGPPTASDHRGEVLSPA